jgi:hypothetical protein
LAAQASDASAGRILWGTAAAGAGIAGGAILLVLTVDRSRWLNLGSLHLLAGLFAISLICWAVRVARRVSATASAGTFARRAILVCAFIQFAFLAATLILLAAGLLALAFGAAIRSALLEALILTLIVSFVTRILCLGIGNTSLVIEEPRGKPATPYWEHKGEP